MPFAPTPSQTVGPFFSIGFDWMYVTDLAAPDAAGERVTVEGCVLDGDQAAVPDAVIELWQANPDGRYAHPEDVQDKPLDPGFRGFGRVPTDADGHFRFSTVKPGPVPGPRGTVQAPHIVVSFFCRGLLRRLVTRMYFPDEPTNAACPVLALAPEARRATLVARRDDRQGHLRWDIVLQGPGETVFFDC